jgi:hypothetical protein
MQADKDPAHTCAEGAKTECESPPKGEASIMGGEYPSGQPCEREQLKYSR